MAGSRFSLVLKFLIVDLDRFRLSSMLRMMFLGNLIFASSDRVVELDFCGGIFFCNVYG